MQEVLVAARDLKVEESLKPEMVKVTTMVKSAVPPNSFKSFKDVEERWVRTPLLESDVLVEKKLGPKGTPPGRNRVVRSPCNSSTVDSTPTEHGPPSRM